MNNLKITRIIKDIEKYLSDIGKHTPITEKILEESRDKEYIISFLIQQIANECINLGNHIISSLNLDIPENSKEIFDILAKNKYIDINVANKIKDVVAIRNIIAHRYIKLSMEELVDVIEDIDVVERFIDQILSKIK